MGNANVNSSKQQSKLDRPYSIDRTEASRNVDEQASSKGYDISSTGNTQNNRRPVLCYQNSSEYGADDTNADVDFKNFNSSRQGIDTFNDQMLPTVFKWDGGGKEVYITGTFSDWKPLKMVQSSADFVTIVDIPEGVHKYKFVVDGVEKIDKNARIDESESNNVLNVEKSDFEVFQALAQDLASNNNNKNNNVSSNAVSGSPPGSYSQKIPTFQETNVKKGKGSQQGPPLLPPHLLQVILNNNSVNYGEPTLLPQPNHVMLNHLYALSIKDGVMVLSAINRYRKKYVTTMLYKPI